jgi:hypothetical protein
MVAVMHTSSFCIKKFFMGLFNPFPLNLHKFSLLAFHSSGPKCHGLPLEGKLGFGDSEGPSVNCRNLKE